MLLELLKNRRSIRKYEDKEIENEKIEALKKIALLSPTSRNKKGWEYIFVDDKQLLTKIADTKPSGGLMLREAALGIVITINESNNDVWVEDGSIAGAYLHLAAHEMGLGSCWVQIRNRMMDYDKGIDSGEEIQKILGIPENQKIVCVISVGYPGEKFDPHSFDKLEYEKIHNNKY